MRVIQIVDEKFEVTINSFHACCVMPILILHLRYIDYLLTFKGASQIECIRHLSMRISDIEFWFQQIVGFEKARVLHMSGFWNYPLAIELPTKILVRIETKN